MIATIQRPGNVQSGLLVLGGSFALSAAVGLYATAHSLLTDIAMGLAFLVFAAYLTGMEMRRSFVAAGAMLLIGQAVWSMRQGFVAPDLILAAVAAFVAVISYRYAPESLPMVHAVEPATQVEAPRNLGRQASSQQVRRGHGENPNSGLVLDADFVVPQQSFEKLAGMQDLKAKLLEAGKSALDRTVTNSRNGILMVGEPGNGKTVFAEALAAELNARFLPISVGQIDGPYIGTRTTLIRNAFARAEAHSPCVLFLDEVDSLLPNRAAASAGMSMHQETTNMVNEVLQLLVRVRGKGVVVVAATNYPDKLDPAAVRPGRFDFKIEVPDPDRLAREAIVGAVFQRARKSKSISFKKAELAATLARWEGFSAATVQAAAVQAVATAEVSAVREIGSAELRAALRATQMSLNNLPAGTKTLAEMVFSASTRKSIEGLAARLKNSEAVEAAGGSLPTGVLFYGPTGTGKTETARVLAKDSGWQFLPTTGTDLVADPSEIDRLYAKAKNLRPCIVFIDEAEDLLRNRTNSSTTLATNKLLAVMDGAKGKLRDLVFVAATNHPEVLDAAMLRGGRFTEKVELEPADAEQIASHMIRSLASRGWCLEGASVRDVAAQMDGMSIANVEAIVQSSINNALADDPTLKVRTIRLEDLVKAIRITQI